MLDESSWDEYHRVRGSYMSICRLASSDRVRFAQSILFSFSLACIHGLRILFYFFQLFFTSHVFHGSIHIRKMARWTQGICGRGKY